MAVPRTQTDAPPVTRTGRAGARACVSSLRVGHAQLLGAERGERVARGRRAGARGAPAASRIGVAPHSFGTRVSRSSTRRRARRDAADGRARVVVAEDPAEVAALAQRIAVGAVLRHPDAVAEAAALDHVVRARCGRGDERGEQGEDGDGGGAGMWLPTQGAGERCGRGVMNASAVASPASGRTVAIRRPGLDGVARGAEQRAELARAGVEVGHHHRHAPQRGRVALHLDDLEDQRPEVDEGLPDGRLGRHAHAAHLEPGRLERGERARQVVRERDDVVDDGRAVRMLAGHRGPGRRRRRSRARPGRSTRQALDAELELRGARHSIRTSPTGAPGAKPSRAHVSGSPGRAIWRATGTNMSVPDGPSAIICRHRDARPRIAAARAAAGARARTAAGSARPGAARARPGSARSCSLVSLAGVVYWATKQSAPRLPQNSVEWLAVLGAMLLYGLATLVRGERWQRAAASTRAATRRAATRRGSTSSATWATTCCPRARATRSAWC